MNDVTIRHNPDRARFEVLVAGNVIGKAVYKEYDAGGSPQRIFYHTVINEEYGGQGLAGQLIKAALDQTVEAGRQIVPVCPFVKSYVAKNPGYAQDTAAIAPAHLTFLNDATARPARA